MRAQQRWTSEWYEASPESNRRVRLLIEGPETAWFEAFTQYRAQGYEVAVCTGPGQSGNECTFLVEGHCPLAEEADVVLSSLDFDEPACRRLVVEMAGRYPDRPLILEGAGRAGDVIRRIDAFRARA